MNTKIILTIIVVILIAIGVIVYVGDDSDQIVSRDRGDREERIDSKDDAEIADDTEIPDNTEDDDDTTPPPISYGDAIVLSSSACSDGTCDTKYVVEVSCGGLLKRKANVWVGNAVGSTKGAMLFFTAGPGNSRYAKQVSRGSSYPATDGLAEMRDAGFQTFEIDWSPEELGWMVEGAGYKNSACAPAEVAQLIHDELLANKSGPMCATGTSGGGFQIGYGLAVYDKEDIYDMVIFAESPPIIQVDNYCFLERFTENEIYEGGFQMTDIIWGWDGNGDYCQANKPNQNVLDILDKDSFITDLEASQRDFHYPNTYSIFLHSSGGNVLKRSIDYFDAITSKKDWVTIPGKVHILQSDEAGMAAITELMLAECK